MNTDHRGPQSFRREPQSNIFSATLCGLTIYDLSHTSMLHRQPESPTFGIVNDLPMSLSRKIPLILLALCLLNGCKHKKKPSLSGDDPIEINDFIEFFEPVKLAYQVNDSTLLRKEKDSLLISYKIFTQFVPDSILTKVFGKGIKPKIYPLGKVVVPKGETYIFVKSTTASKKAAFVVSFSGKNEFLAGMPILVPDAYASTAQSATMDRRYVITKSILRKNADASFSEGKDVYVLNTEGKNFMLIMTDALEDKPTELVNPIDTLPRKHKWAADYTSGKMNMVSVRDGRKTDRVSFFIHFEKNNGACTGELKGEAYIVSPTVAEYREGGDPCKLKFIFTSTSVSLKEEEGCGSHRGLRCSFDGSFARKKEIKQKKPASKTK